MTKNKSLSILPEDIEKGLFPEEDFGDIKNNFILIYFIKNENGELILNYQKPIDYSENNNKETVIRNQNGIYELKIYSLKGQILEKILFNPSSNKFYEILAIPNYLNIGKLELVNLNNNKEDNLDLSPISICNENNICEKGEENICPFDCPKINNPNYPLKNPLPSNQAQEIPVSTNIQTTTPSLPKNYFYQLFFLSSFIFIILFLLIVFFIKKFKK